MPSASNCSACPYCWRIFLSEIDSRSGFQRQPGVRNRFGYKFDYHNTFYHQEPRLDVTRAGSDEDHGAYDFILAGEIFEHVPPSVDDTLTNVRSLLKPDGFLVLTVPYSTEATTR